MPVRDSLDGAARGPGVEGTRGAHDVPCPEVPDGFLRTQVSDRKAEPVRPRARMRSPAHGPDPGHGGWSQPESAGVSPTQAVSRACDFGIPGRARLNVVLPPEEPETGRPVRSSPSKRTRRVALNAAASCSGALASARTRLFCEEPLVPGRTHETNRSSSSPVAYFCAAHLDFAPPSTPFTIWIWRLRKKDVPGLPAREFRDLQGARLGRRQRCQASRQTAWSNTCYHDARSVQPNRRSHRKLPHSRTPAPFPASDARPTFSLRFDPHGCGSAKVVDHCGS